ncbi:MAG: hypothetical protein AB7P04_00235 [Bacteriovoracia bacterium]
MGPKFKFHFLGLVLCAWMSACAVSTNTTISRLPTGSGNPENPYGGSGGYRMVERVCEKLHECYAVDIPSVCMPLALENENLEQVLGLDDRAPAHSGSPGGGFAPGTLGAGGMLTPVGVTPLNDTVFNNLSAIFDAEIDGAVIYNPAAGTSCGDQVEQLSCTHPILRRAYNAARGSVAQVSVKLYDLFGYLRTSCGRVYSYAEVSFSQNAAGLTSQPNSLGK